MFSQEGILDILNNDEVLKDQLTIGNYTYRNFIDTGQLLSDKKDVVFDFDYTVAAIPFTVALEHTLEKLFIKDFKTYCENNGRQVPPIIENILDPGNRDYYFALGKFRYILADASYHNMARGFFKHKFKNITIKHNYSVKNNTDGNKIVNTNSFQFVQGVNDLSKIRNKAAHEGQIDLATAKKVKNNIIGLTQEDIQTYRFNGLRLLISLLKDIKR